MSGSDWRPGAKLFERVTVSDVVGVRAGHSVMGSLGIGVPCLTSAILRVRMGSFRTRILLLLRSNDLAG